MNMPTPIPDPPAPSGSSLAALFLASKKALLHGNTVCNAASTLTAGANNLAVDVLTLDAKLRWLTHGVLDQLKAATTIVKFLELEREHVHSVAKDWDRARSQRTRSLDAILEQLGNQAVPPSLHKTVTGSSVFGSPRSDAGKELPGTELNGKTSTRQETRPNQDRSRWKTLRDFIDERAIEEALERIEEERLQLDDCLARTYDFPQTLAAHITAIRDSLPQLSIEPVLHVVHRLSTEKDQLVRGMAEDLEGIVRHFGQVKDAMRVEDDGGVIDLEDLKTLDQDTEELSAVIRDIDQSGRSVEELHEQLCAMKSSLLQGLETHRTILGRLEDLDEIMTAMLSEQQTAQHDVEALLETLESRLVELENLENAYVAYRGSYAHLLQEMVRRERHRAEMEEIVHGMLERLDRYREEEIQRRHEFFTHEGEFIPEDLCPFVTDPPARWSLTSTGEDDARVMEDGPGLLEEARRILESG